MGQRLVQVLWNKTVYLIDIPLVPAMIALWSAYDFLVGLTEEIGYIAPRTVCCHICLCVEDHRLCTKLIHDDNCMQIIICLPCFKEIEFEIDGCFEPYETLEIEHAQNKTRSV